MLGSHLVLKLALARIRKEKHENRGELKQMYLDTY